MLIRTWRSPDVTDAEALRLGPGLIEKSSGALTLRFVMIPTPDVLRSGISIGQCARYWGPLIFGVAISLLSGIGVALTQHTKLAWVSRSFETALVIGLVEVVVYPLSVMVVAMEYSSWLRTLRTRYLQLVGKYRDPRPNV